MTSVPPMVLDLVEDYGPPVRFGDGATCAVGLLQRSMGIAADEFGRWMPTRSDAAATMMEFGLPPDTADRVACQIIAANDRGDFNHALRLLAVAHKIVYRDAKRRARASRIRRPLIGVDAQATFGRRLLAAAIADSQERISVVEHVTQASPAGVRE